MVSSCKINGYDNENGLTNGNSASAASSKISKITRRIRESCQQHLRKKHSSGGASSRPEDYGSISAPNVSINIVKTRNNPLRRYILGVLTHTNSWDRHWGGDETLK